MAALPARGLFALLAFLVMPAGCAPLVRFGEIEPPPGEQVLVEVEVRPEVTGIDRAELAAAMESTGVAGLATAPAPKVASSTVVDEISSNVQSLSIPADNALVDEAELATDARRLESIYMARGYYRAKLLGYELPELRPDRRKAIFEIRENSPTHVSEIRFLGACELAGVTDPKARDRLRELCSELSDLIPMRVGDLWDEQTYASGLDVLARAFRAQGFLHARVTGDSWVSRDQYKAAVWYEIAAGPLVRVRGDVRIEGHQRVTAERIRRRVDIDAGDIIDQEMLRRTERAVVELGPFFSAQAQPVRGDRRGPIEEAELAAYLPLKIQVAEAPRWELTVGPSFVTDFVRMDLALPTRFIHRNLFDELVALEAKARPALVFPDCFTGAACTDKTEFGLDSKLTLQVPSFFEEFLRFAVDATYRRDPTQDTKSQEVGGSVGLSRRLVEGLTARVGYNLAFFNYFDSGALSGLSGADALAQSDLRFETQDLLAYLDLALVLDIRDSPLDARNGIYAALSANFADQLLGSQVAYTRLIGDVRGYYSPRFLSWLSLAARLKVGWNLFPSGQGTPQPARFKSGGATTMRGFATDRLGDFVCATPTSDGRYINNPGCGDDSTDRTYIGGNYLVESNFELRFHFRGGLGLAAFVDIGRVWSLRSDVDLDKLFVAVGPGLRYDLPVGPIRVDLGFLLGRQRGRELHISLGQAF